MYKMRVLDIRVEANFILKMRIKWWIYLRGKIISMNTSLAESKERLNNTHNVKRLLFMNNNWKIMVWIFDLIELQKFVQLIKLNITIRYSNKGKTLLT